MFRRVLRQHSGLYTCFAENAAANTSGQRETQKPDEGLYACEAGNGVGSDISRVVRLTVNVGAHFKKSFQILRLKIGQTLRVSCEAFGEKPLSLKWRRGRGEVGDRYSVTERQTEEGIISELRTDNAERSDSSIFSCFAFNLWGKSEMTVQVVVEEEPDPVLDLRVAELGPKSASIQWSEPFSGNNAINKYIIEWKKGKYLSRVLPFNHFLINLKGLKTRGVEWRRVRVT